MGLFSGFRKEKPSVDWNDAYPATPKFYEAPDGTPFGAVALTEETTTILPKAPQNRYSVDGKPASDWKMVFVSTTKDDILGDCNYFAAMVALSYWPSSWSSVRNTSWKRFATSRKNLATNRTPRITSDKAAPFALGRGGFCVIIEMI